MVRIQSNCDNYKEGFLTLHCPSRDYIVEKMLMTARQKQLKMRQWVNYSDIGLLNKYGSLRKELLKELSECHSNQEDPLYNVTTLNVLSVLESKKELLDKLREKSIRSHLGLVEGESFKYTNCYFTNEAIVYQ